MPIISAAFTSRWVISRSSRLGCTLPLGWLWARITLAALARIAGLKTSRGCTRELESVPTEIVGISKTSFFVLSNTKNEVLPITVCDPPPQETVNVLWGGYHGTPRVANPPHPFPKLDRRQYYARLRLSYAVQPDEVVNGGIVQSKQVPTLGDYFAGKLYGGLLAGTDAEEYA